MFNHWEQIKYFILMFIIFNNGQYFVSCNVLPVDILRAEVIHLSDSLWTDVNDYTNRINVSVTRNQLLSYVFNNYYRIINRYKSPLQKNFPIDYFNALMTHSEWQTKKNDYLNASDTFSDFRNFIGNIRKMEMNSINNDFNAMATKIKSMTTRSSSLVELNANTRFYDQLKKTIEDSCSLTISKQEYLTLFYTDQTLTEIKVFMMVNFMWLVDTLLNAGSHVLSKASTNSLFKQYSEANQNKFIESYVGTDSFYYRCDPDEHVYKKTYYKFTYFDQGYVINERYMKGDTCRYDCTQFITGITNQCTTTNSEGRYPECSERKWCTKFHYCEDRGNSLQTCTTDNEKTLDRRFKFIQSAQSTHLKQCDGALTEAKAKFTYYTYECLDCVCYCDDFDDDSFRTVSLQQQVTTGFEVITGMKVVLLNRIFYLQIQVGTLISKTEIDQTSLRWVPINEIRDINYNSDSPPQYFVMRRNNRFDMDVYTVSHDEYITGVRFYRKFIGHSIKDVDKYGLKFSVQVTKGMNINNHFNLVSSTSKWLLNDVWHSNHINKRMKNNPEHMIGKSKRISRDTGDFIRFMHTSFENDSAQTAVPLWDAQPVQPLPAEPLKGAGFILKTSSQYGGFLAPIVKLKSTEGLATFNKEWLDKQISASEPLRHDDLI